MLQPAWDDPQSQEPGGWWASGGLSGLPSAQRPAQRAGDIAFSPSSLQEGVITSSPGPG